jgi:hypothetical protein
MCLFFDDMTMMGERFSDQAGSEATKWWFFSTWPVSPERSSRFHPMFWDPTCP